MTVHDVTAPVIGAFPADATYECAGQIPPPNTSLVTATDACGPVTITHLGDVGNGGAGCAASPLVVTRTYRASDGSGNHTDRNQTFTVVDTTAPTITAFPPNQNLSCPSQIPPPNTALVAANDACGGTVFVTHTSDQSNGGSGCIDSPLVVTRTYHVADACGNGVSQSQVFTVVDTQAPVIEVAPDDMELSCAAEIPAPDVAAIVATDNCDPNVTVTHQGDVSNNGSGCSSSPLVVTRTYRATDACGQFVEASQVFTVIDTTAPVVDLPPPAGHATADCGSAILPDLRSTLVATDNCGTIEVTQDPGSGTVLAVGAHTVTFTIVDLCGNEATTSTTFTVDADTCPADLNGNGAVDPSDLAVLLGSWGPCPGCCANLDGDGAVGPTDLALLLGSWGPCPTADAGDPGTPAGDPTANQPPALADGDAASQGAASAASPRNGTGRKGVTDPATAGGLGAAEPGVLHAEPGQGFVLVEGAVALAASDRLVVEVDVTDLAATTVLVVRGPARLGGTLVVELTASDPEQAAQGLASSLSVPILLAESLEGTFDQVEIQRSATLTVDMPTVRTRVEGGLLSIELAPVGDSAAAAPRAPRALGIDLDGDGIATSADLLRLASILEAVGPAPSSVAAIALGLEGLDLDGNGLLDGHDLVEGALRLMR